MSKNRLPAQKEKLPKEFEELKKQIEEVPAPLREKMERSFGQIVESRRRNRRILELVQGAISELRMDIKYLMFDLDCTKRERDELRKKEDETN